MYRLFLRFQLLWFFITVLLAQPSRDPFRTPILPQGDVAKLPIPDFYKLLSLCENYAPGHHQELSSLLDRIKPEARDALETMSFLKMKNPLELAMAKTDLELTQLILQKTGALFCERPLQTIMPYSDTAFKIASSLASAGCTPSLILYNKQDESTFFGMNVLFIIEYAFNNPLLPHLIKYIDNKQFMEQHREFLLFLIKHALKSDAFFAMSSIMQMKTQTLDVFQTTETFSIMEYALKYTNDPNRLGMCIGFLFNFIRSTDDIEFIKRHLKNKKLPHATQSVLNDIELAFQSDDINTINRYHQKHPKLAAFLHAKINAFFKAENEIQAHKVMDELSSWMKPYKRMNAQLAELRIKLGRLDELISAVDAYPKSNHDLLELKKLALILKKPHWLNEELKGENGIYGEMTNRQEIKYFLLNQGMIGSAHFTADQFISTDLKQMLFLTKSFEPILEMIDSTQNTSDPEYKEAKLTNLLSLILGLNNYKIHLLQNQLAILFYELFLTATNQYIIENSYRMATFEMPHIGMNYVDSDFHLNAKEAVLLSLSNQTRGFISMRLRQNDITKHAQLEFIIQQLRYMNAIHTLDDHDYLSYALSQTMEGIEKEIVAMSLLFYIDGILDYCVAQRIYNSEITQLVTQDIKHLQALNIIGNSFRLPKHETMTLAELEKELSYYKPKAESTTETDNLKLLSGFSFGFIIGYGAYRLVRRNYPRVNPTQPSHEVKQSKPKPLAKPVEVPVADGLPNHPFLGTNKIIQLNPTPREKHKIAVDLPAFIPKESFPVLENNDWDEEMITLPLIETALKATQASNNSIHVSVSNVDDDSFTLLLEIDNHATLFHKQYESFMRQFQDALIKAAPQYKHAMERQRLLLSVQQIQSDIENHKRLIQTHLADLHVQYALLLIEFANEVATKSNSRFVRSKARDLERICTKLLELKKFAITLPTLTQSTLSYLSNPELTSLELKNKKALLHLTPISQQLKNGVAKADDALQALKTQIKQDNEKFNFSWPTTEPDEPPISNETFDEVSVLEPTIEEQNDPTPINNVPERITNEDDDGDPEEQTTQSHSPKPLTLIEEQMIAAPLHWLTRKPGRAVSSSAATNSNTYFKPVVAVSPHVQTYLNTTKQLCERIRDTATEMNDVHLDVDSRRKKVYQLIDLYAVLHLNCHRLIYERALSKHGFVNDIQALRNVLRHNAILYLNSDYDEKPNQLITEFSVNLPQAYQEALRNPLQTKQANAAILTASSLRQEIDPDQHLLALAEDFRFLHNQLSKHSALAHLVMDGHIHFYCGYLSQIGNAIHALIHAAPSMRSQLLPTVGSPIFHEIAEYQQQNGPTLQVGSVPIGQLLHCCLQLRNMRGHELENVQMSSDDVTSRFVMNLMRCVAAALPELITHVERLQELLITSVAVTSSLTKI